MCVSLRYFILCVCVNVRVCLSHATLKTNLMRCNSQTMYFAHLKDSIGWFLLYLLTCAVINTINLKFVHRLKNSVPINIH